MGKEEVHYLFENDMILYKDSHKGSEKLLQDAICKFSKIVGFYAFFRNHFHWYMYKYAIGK